jgi:plasmid stabilization system protein ParE
LTPVVLLRGAQADLPRAARFYEEETAGLGANFLVEAGRPFALLEENPEIGAPLPRGARKLLLHRFPYLVIYRTEAERVLVLAVGHQRRHPDFWLGRA